MPLMNEDQDMANICIRPYATSDWERLCEIHDAARYDELRLTVGEEAFLSLEQTAESEGLFEGDLFVAEVDGRVRGFVAYTTEELTWLYSDPQIYRQGIGRALLRHALAHTNPGVRTEVLEGNEPALSLYLSEGFEITKRVEGNLEGKEAYQAVGYIMEYQKAN